MKILTIISAFILFSSSVFAKRIAPSIIKPLVKNKTEYSLKHQGFECQNSKEICGMKVSIISKDLKKDKIKWEKDLYQKIYDLQEETDVQDVYPSSFEFNKKGQLKVIDENGSMYLINPETGELIQPLKSIIYPTHH